jgi:uroporphyrinogen decarboxylase
LLTAAAESGANVLSVDWRVDLAAVRELIGPRIALQGNVDPCVLLGPEESVRRAAREAVEGTGGVAHILNLGHGILQQTPVENARAFVLAGQAAAVIDRVRVERAR